MASSSFETAEEGRIKNTMKVKHKPKISKEAKYEKMLEEKDEKIKDLEEKLQVTNDNLKRGNKRLQICEKRCQALEKKLKRQNFGQFLKLPKRKYQSQESLKETEVMDEILDKLVPTTEASEAEGTSVKSDGEITPSTTKYNMARDFNIAMVRKTNTTKYV